MIEATYKEPKLFLSRTEKRKLIKINGRNQAGMPTFTLPVYPTTNHDRTRCSQNLSLQEHIDLAAGQLHNINLSELYHADATFIVAPTAKAAETILEHIEYESKKYNMKLNYDKRIHLRINDMHTISYRNGEEMPMKTEATYLGGKIFANGSYKKEIRHRATNTWITVRKLDLLWKKHLSHSSGN